MPLASALQKQPSLPVYLHQNADNFTNLSHNLTQLLLGSSQCKLKTAGLLNANLPLPILPAEVTSLFVLQDISLSL